MTKPPITRTGTTHKIRIGGTCLYLSRQDSCCSLTGETRHGDNAACCDHSNGKVIARVLDEESGWGGNDQLKA